MWLRDRGFLWLIHSAEGDKRDQFLWVCPVYASSFAQLNQGK